MTAQGNGTNPTPGQGQPSQPVAQQPQAASGQEQTPQYVTQAQLEAAIQKVIANSQQVTGKMESRIQKKLDTLQAAGIQATPQQAQALLDAEAPGDTQTGQPATGQPPAQATSQPPASPDAITTQALAWMKEDGMTEGSPTNLEGYKIMAEIGYRLMNDDPELQEIDPKADPETWKKQVRAAAEKAKTRREREGKPARMASIASGQATGQPSHSGKTGTQTLEEYFKSLHLT